MEFYYQELESEVKDKKDIKFGPRNVFGLIAASYFLAFNAAKLFDPWTFWRCHV